MKKKRFRIGSVINAKDSSFYTLEFEVEELAKHKTRGPGYMRGTTETLYRAKDGHVAVYVEHWSEVPGEKSTYYLQEVTRKDLAPGGRFEALGKQFDGDL